MTDPLIWIALAAGAGSLSAGMLGWLDTGGTFDWRKFASNVIRAITAGMTYALGQKLSEYTGATLYFYAFLGGAGIDIILNRAQGSLGKNSAVPHEEAIAKISRDLQKIAESRTKGKTDAT
jgi:hypothetical protein